MTACLFDLDGVLTQTAHVHNSAWEEMFNAYLRDRADRTHEAFVPYDPGRDYREHIDGRARADGVRGFLTSRGITLPEGTPDDSPEAETVNGLGNRKNELFLSLLKEHGVQVYEGSVAYLRAVREAGLRTAVVSASKNCCDVVEAAGLVELLEERVDGEVAAEEGLTGKPAPDTFLAAARRLGVTAAQAVVYEDALAGVEAGRAGNFGYVVGVDRVGQANELREHGADVVVSDLSELMGERAS